MFEFADVAQQQINAIPDVYLNDDFYTDHFARKSGPLLDSVPEENHAKIRGHATS